ncbi:hypothetical protein DPMN_163870 [Dreissena polymorpha]|uniref:Uncharacterized protein n=1 Tax=Dreissena polymorpha TaxID=45954 RepID=A0A9D4EU30_DREPO|nr:hypothetical protein DPMN_163870 [Dreissena polymorpha]
MDHRSFFPKLIRGMNSSGEQALNLLCGPRMVWLSVCGMGLAGVVHQLQLPLYYGYYRGYQ